MSQQQMNFDETNRQQQSSSFDNYEAGYKDPFMNTFGAQKISAQPTRSNAPSAGMRLALAIVSLCLLVPLSAIILGVFASAGLIFAGLIGLGLVCFTIITVNAVFGYRR